MVAWKPETGFQNKLASQMYQISTHWDQVREPASRNKVHSHAHTCAHAHTVCVCGGGNNATDICYKNDFENINLSVGGSHCITWFL